MAIQLSTGLRNAILASGSVKDTLDLGFIKIYGGTAPADANQAENSAQLLCTISVASGGTGITFDAAASNGTLLKNSSEVWSGIVGLTGEATHYRHVAASDTGAVSSTEPRIQGTIGISGEDMNLSSVNLQNGATQTIDYYVVAMPST